MTLSPKELERYARHLSLPQVGLEGQEKLKAAKVLCIGAGGLGSPLAMFLAAAGVGKLGLVDADVVDGSNLHRQLLHGESDIGRKKLASAAETLKEVNPHVELALHETRFEAANAMDLARGYDLIIDGTDNFPTRYLSNDVAFFLGIPNVYGSIYQFEGQVSFFHPHGGGPCYRCLFPTPPKPGMVPSCAEGGVFGVLPGIIGSLQATEAIKHVLGIGDSLKGRLVHLDTLSMRIRTFQLRKDPQCPLCGETPTITKLVDYEAFCGLTSENAESELKMNPDTNAIDWTPTMVASQWEKRAITLVDVREDFERSICQIDGALAIPLGQLSEHLDELPRDRQVVFFCKSGIRSVSAIVKAREAGFNDAVHLAGGILAWRDDIDPTLTPY